MKELSLQFLFEADAGMVYSFIMGLQKTRPDLFKSTSGKFNYTCWLKGLRRDGLYSIALQVSILDPRRSDDVLVRDRYIAEITFSQEEAGECKGSLYIETDPKAWYRPEDSPWRHLEELEEPWYVPMNMGTKFVISLWRSLIALNMRQAYTEYMGGDDATGS